MSVLAWRARIRAVPGAGGGTGAGFLIAPDLVMTCAHVVQGRVGVRVDFLGVEHDLSATVEPCTDWGVKGDGGDVALVRLDAPTRVRPASLARPRDLEPLQPTPGNPHGLRTYSTYGFPKSGESFERHATVRSGPHMVQRQEWWQLNVDKGEPVRKGFSGAAVYDPVTGRVAGMVTEADSDSGSAKMLPITTIRRYWEELDDLLPLEWLTPEARRELRALLAGARPTDPIREEIFRATGQRPTPRSVWDSVRYVAEGWPTDPDRLRAFLIALGGHLPRETAWRHDHWIGRHLPGGGHRASRARPSARTTPAAVIVRLDPLTHGDFDLTVQTWIDGVTRTSHRTERVTKDDVQRTIETRVHEASREVVDHDWRIEFAVPLRWLTKPFGDWHIGGRHMRLFPLVVRDVERLRPHSAGARSGEDHLGRYLARQRWERLCEEPAPPPYPIGCDTHPRGQAELERKLEASLERALLVYGIQPHVPWLKAALSTGVPVMLWPRAKCSASRHGDCVGHRLRDDLVKAVTGTAVADLPRIAMELRRQAADHADDEPHCGRGLTLFYDDPGRLPDPPCSMEN